MTDFLHGDLKKIYLKYLAASFGSAFASSIYGVVDMVMVGQYHGPSGSAAMAIIAPIWNILYSFGLLAGIGGSVLFSAARGKGKSRQEQNECFTAAFLLTILFSLILWAALNIYEIPLLKMFGASEELLPLAQKYLMPVRYTAPIFLFTQFLASFLRNDGAASLATKAVMLGGIVNVFGDYILVFPCNLGILGAAYATVGSAAVSVLVMLTHFTHEEHALHLVRPAHLFETCRRIISTGFSTFFIDIAMGFITMLFNRQIMRYLNADALAVYGIIVNLSTFVQCCAYGVGQASQPLLSVNFAAGQKDRIHQLLKYNLLTIAIISAIWIFLTLAFPNGFVKLFMSPTDSVLQIAPSIMRCYCLSFLFLPLNIYATYYFQSALKPMVSLTVSFLRGAVISGILILILPVLFNGNALWWAMPITELCTAVFAVIMMKKMDRAFAR